MDTPLSKQKHWTSESIDDFVYRIGADFVAQIEASLDKDKDGGQQNKLAEALGVTPARVSQVLNNPGNLTLRSIVEYARARGLKVSVVAYDDGDPTNERGPINSQVIEQCWERAGKPADMFDLEDAATHSFIISAARPSMQVPVLKDAATNRAATYATSETAGTHANKLRLEPMGVTTNG